MRGKEVNRRLTADRQPSDSSQTPNGSCSTDVATLERENKDLKVIIDVWCYTHEPFHKVRLVSPKQVSLGGRNYIKVRSLAYLAAVLFNSYPKNSNIVNCVVQ